MSDTSSSQHTPLSLPPLRITADHIGDVSPLSYPDQDPLQLYAHEQYSHSTFGEDSSISTQPSQGLTATCRKVIENLSNHFTSPQEQSIMEDILQECATFDSLQTQYTKNQRTIQDQMSLLIQTTTNIQQPGTPPLAQQAPENSHSSQNQ